MDDMDDLDNINNIENRLQIDLPPLERSRRVGGMKLLTMILILLLFVICGIVGFFAGKLYGTNLIPPEDDTVALEFFPAGETQEAPRRVLTVLIIGVDQRYKNEPSRSDALILGCFNLDTKEVNLISVPRDTRVEIPGRNIMRKINYAHTVGGPDLSKETVRDLLRVPVDYYVETNFQGFEKCIDILGGVSLDVERAMYYPEENIDLKAGAQKLNGYDALAYCRWRGDGMGDIGRIERQQKFIQALSKQVFSLAALPKIPSLITEISQNLDTDMNLAQMIKLAREFLSLGQMEINSHTIPGEGDSVHYGGSYWIMDEEKTRELTASIFSPEDQSEAASQPGTTAGRSSGSATSLGTAGTR
ncbi:MAG: LCP family protein [Peptococcaceae bacterium]|jgi:LCP family protein required for cell wall assembly|nr:LCP family protein [Peptococcaceae bacterium]